MESVSDKAWKEDLKRALKQEQLARDNELARQSNVSNVNDARYQDEVDARKGRDKDPT